MWPWKTPYNSWGKPIWELFFISENVFTEKLKYTVKILATTNYNLSRFPCLHSALKIVPINKQPKQKFSSNKTALNVVLIASKNVPRPSCTDCMDFSSTADLKFVPKSTSKFMPLLLSLFLDFCAVSLPRFLCLSPAVRFCLGMHANKCCYPDLLKCILASLLYFLIAQKFSHCSLFSLSQMLIKKWIIFSSSLLLLLSKWPLGLP